MPVRLRMVRLSWALLWAFTEIFIWVDPGSGYVSILARGRWKARNSSSETLRALVRMFRALRACREDCLVDSLDSLRRPS
eukprot:scaffold661447_cov48-Prasinocladus_malaysianus.AAC.1